MSFSVVCDSLWYAELPTSVLRLQGFSGVDFTCCCTRSRMVELQHVSTHFSVTYIHVLAACFVVRMNY
jgi:hypothetical protein